MTEFQRISTLTYSGPSVMAPEYMRTMANEVLEEVVKTLSAQESMKFCFAYMLSADLCARILTMKIKQLEKSLSTFQKTLDVNMNLMASMIFVLYYMVNDGLITVEMPDSMVDGFCFMSELSSISWMSVAFNFIGSFPTPWLVDCLYRAHSGHFWFPECETQGSCVIRGNDGEVKISCMRCHVQSRIVGQQRMFLPAQGGVSRLPPRSNLMVRELDQPGHFHFVGYHDHPTMSHQSEVAYRAQHGEGRYYTFHLLRQREDFFNGNVGAPEVVTIEDSVVDDCSVVPLTVNQKKQTVESIDVQSLTAQIRESIMRELESQHKRQIPQVQSVLPDESASQVTARPTNGETERKNLNMRFGGSVYNADDQVTVLSRQVADLTNNMGSLMNKHRVHDYTRIEYDEDLQEAFESSGVVNKDGQLYLQPLCHTGASELVPQITTDKRLNFLIRLHTAIFKIVPDTPDYPRPGIMDFLRSVVDGHAPDDHPSFDLLQIVLTDTLDFNHNVVKNNNFLLPVLESGMRFNERIVAMCLLSLKGEFFGRNGAVFKDCILPKAITDTSRWSDDYAPSNSRRITAKRPDLAIDQRNAEKKHYKRRKDSFMAR